MTKSLMRSVTGMVYKVIIMPPAKRRLDRYVFLYDRDAGKQTGGESDPCGCERDKEAVIHDGRLPEDM